MLILLILVKWCYKKLYVVSYCVETCKREYVLALCIVISKEQDRADFSEDFNEINEESKDIDEKERERIYG